MNDSDQIQELCAEAMRANADRVFATKCNDCGKKFKRSLGWLQERKFKCPDCGGGLDDKPLHEITMSVLKEIQNSPSLPRPKAGEVAGLAVGSDVRGGSKYQLVLQFREDSLQDLDALVALENELIAKLGGSADVDGHDYGAGEMNIFILTSDPSSTFITVKPVLKTAKLINKMTAAYRDINGEDFTVIWPNGFAGTFEVT